MGTHYSMGIVLEYEDELLYVSNSSNGAPECIGEYMLDTIRTHGINGLIHAMLHDDLELVDRDQETIFTYTKMEEWHEWTFSEWVYLYRFDTDSIAICVPSKGEDVNFTLVSGKNPYGGEYGLHLVLEVPIRGTETVMDVWERTRSLKRVGTYLTLYK